MVAGGENIFVNPGDELAAQVEAIVSRLALVSGFLPASTQADAESHYSCAPGQTVGATQDALLLRTGAVCVLARALGMNEAPLTTQRVLQIHHGIFLPIFGDATLGFRATPDRGEHRVDDGVIYPIWIVDGPGREPRTVPRRGAVANQVFRRVEEACKDYERAAGEVRRDVNGVADPEEGSRILARLYVRLIRIHPFGDGNGRTAWAALQYAAGRLRFPLVQSSPTMEARLALGDAIRRGNNIDSLAAHIRSAAWGSAEK